MRKHCRWQDIVVACDLNRFAALEEIRDHQASPTLVTIGASSRAWAKDDWLLFFVGLKGPDGGIAARFEHANDAFNFALRKAVALSIDRVREVWLGSESSFRQWLNTPSIELDGVKTPRKVLYIGVLDNVIEAAKQQNRAA